jgi:nucleoside 2-deoxyribosyltransferase
MTMVHKIYLSGPLFSAGEIAWGEELSSFLSERLKDTQIIWPHEIVPDGAEPVHIFRANLKALDECDLTVAILDGAQVDDGTAWEIGYFFSQGKKILGIRTDFRRAGESDGSRVNLMIECSCLRVVSSIDELLLELERLLD